MSTGAKEPRFLRILSYWQILYHAGFMIMNFMFFVTKFGEQNAGVYFSLAMWVGIAGMNTWISEQRRATSKYLFEESLKLSEELEEMKLTNSKLTEIIVAVNPKALKEAGYSIERQE